MIGKDGKILFVRHGREVIRAHEVDIREATENEIVSYEISPKPNVDDYQVGFPIPSEKIDICEKVTLKKSIAIN